MPLYFKWIVEARSLPQTRCGTSKNFQWSLFRKCSKKLWLSFSNKARPTEKELSLLQRPLRALFDCFGCTGQLDLFLSLLLICSQIWRWVLMRIETSSNGWHRFLVFSFVILRTMPSGRADSSESFGRYGPSRWREAGGHPCAPGDCGPKKKTNIDRCWWPTCRKQADAKAAEIHSIQWLLRGSWTICFLLSHLSSTASCTSSGNVLYIEYIVTIVVM